MEEIKQINYLFLTVEVFNKLKYDTLRYFFILQALTDYSPSLQCRQEFKHRASIAIYLIIGGY